MSLGSFDEWSCLADVATVDDSIPAQGELGNVTRRKMLAQVIALSASCMSAGVAPGQPRTQADATPSIAARYRETAQRIVSATLANNDAYRRLEELCLRIGHRLSGSPQLDRAIEWAVGILHEDGQENVRREKVMVPHWVRGEESVILVEPRSERLHMLGLGGSIGTPPEGITAPVVVVGSEQELESIGDETRGKIVLFNHAMRTYDPETGSGYGTASRYRSKGASLASQRGAVGCLVRSATARSLRSPHTGGMRYEDGHPKIPTAAISIEDADLIARMRRHGLPVVVNLRMAAKTLPDVESANVVGELRGTTWPDEVVVIGGHIDSWDVGQGAHDDGAGCVMAMEAIHVLRKLQLIPRRTIRVVLWTNEENGLAGARAYAADHTDELAKHVVAIEADSGGFRPTGYSVECETPTCAEAAVEQLRDLVSVLSSVAPLAIETGGTGADISILKPAGVVLMGHNVEGSTYFDYHHTYADTIDKVDPEELSRNVAVMATVAYILADMPERLGVPAKR
jgi:carboxypeptidase Q